MSRTKRIYKGPLIGRGPGCLGRRFSFLLCVFGFDHKLTKMFVTQRATCSDCRAPSVKKPRAPSKSVPLENPQIPRPDSKMLSVSYSGSLKSVLSRYHSDWGLNQVHQVDMVELQRIRDVKVAAQAKNMEEFLKMHGLSLDDCTARKTGMRYR